MPSLIRIFVLVVAAALTLATGARAADWVERPFDPPIGSRWIIQSDENAEDNRGTQPVKSTMKQTAELTIDEKVPEGFRVTYVVRSVTFEGGDPRLAAIIGPLTKAIENLVIHGTLGPNGAPLRVDNLAEVQATARTAIDGLVAAFADKPQVAAMVRQMANGMLIGDAKQAPRIYLGELRTIALGQSTGMHPGETRADSDEVPNPLGGPPMKSNAVLRIDNVDAATGNVRFVRTRTFDADSIKEFVARLVKQIGIAQANDPQKLEAFMKQLTLSLEGRTEIDVEGGMTRTVREDETMTASIIGHTMTKREHKVMTITRAP